MQMSDVIADMLTRIRNANDAKHQSVDIPASNMKRAIADILLEEGYIKAFQVVEDGKQGIIRITLKYGEGKAKVIHGLRRVSKPGLRIYASCEDMPRVMNGLGIAIVSTSKGVMTDKKARLANVGGEVLTIPAGVTVTVAEGNVVTVKGKLGEVTETFNPALGIKVDGATLTVSRPDDEKENRALHGLTRALIANMVKGVTEGFSKKLEIVGVGYKVEKQGKKIVLNLGHSHPIYFEEGNGITFEIPDNTTIIVKGYDKQAVGQIAAVIRSKRPPEPYLGKGVKYSGEKIRRKAGKTGK